MKRLLQSFFLVAVMLLSSTTIFAQKAPKVPKFITVTTMHWNMDNENFDMDTWKSIEKEYLDKVTKKNEFVLGTSFYMHYFTEDNTELIYVSSYESWEAIEKAGTRADELEKEAWPDENARKDYFKKRNNYYADIHSDEIYAPISGAKIMVEKPTKNMILYVRKSHFASPEDGSKEEFDALRKEGIEKIINKNEYIKAYYPNVHAWGSDKTEFVEAFIVESLGDIDKMFDKTGELAKAAWPDEAKRKERAKKGSKYFTGIHGDYIYTYVYDLSK